jgi:chromosome segregation ATPase
MQQLADARRRLATAEDTQAETQAALKDAEGEYDAAADRVTAAERALDDAMADRGQALRKRYTARQAHERASAAVARLQRRVDDISGRLDRMPLTTGPAGHYRACVRFSAEHTSGSRAATLRAR